MRRALDRLAAAAATRLVAWLSLRVDPSQREWIDAMRAELDAIDGGWEQLAWSIGGLPLAWAFRRARAPQHKSFFPRRTQLGNPVWAAVRSGFSSLALNLLTLAVWWLMLFGWLALVNRSGRLYIPLTTMAACVVGAVIALSARRFGAAYVLAGSAVMQSVALVFHSFYGGLASFPTLGAGILGVTCGALMEHLARSAVDRPLGTAPDLFDRARFAAVTVRQKVGFAAHALSGVTAFAVIELVIRPAGLHPFGVANYAIISAAMLGAFLGALMEMSADRLAFQNPWRRHGSSSTVSR